MGTEALQPEAQISDPLSGVLVWVVAKEKRELGASWPQHMLSLSACWTASPMYGVRPQ